MIWNKVKTYSCSRSESFRYLRLRQIGDNQSTSNALSLSKIEFFGVLKTDYEAERKKNDVLRAEERKRTNGEFNFVDDRPFWGILSHLSDECGGNVHYKGIVNITASSDSDHGQSHQVTNYGWGGYWKSDSLSNAWICFDFKEKRV